MYRLSKGLQLSFMKAIALKPAFPTDVVPLPHPGGPSSKANTGCMGAWLPLSEAIFPGEAPEEVCALLRLLGVPLLAAAVEDSTAKRLIQFFVEGGFKVNICSPARVREELKKVALSAPALKNDAAVICTLKYVLKDAQHADLVGLPLLLFEGGRVCFGRPTGQPSFVLPLDDAERSALGFVDGLLTSKKFDGHTIRRLSRPGVLKYTNVRLLSPSLLASLLKKHYEKPGNCLRPHTLAALWKFLASKIADLSPMHSLPLLPTSKPGTFAKLLSVGPPCQPKSRPT
jgi:hypothetical protein